MLVLPTIRVEPGLQSLAKVNLGFQSKTQAFLPMNSTRTRPPHYARVS